MLYSFQTVPPKQKNFIPIYPYFQLNFWAKVEKGKTKSTEMSIKGCFAMHF